MLAAAVSAAVVRAGWCHFLAGVPAVAWIAEARAVAALPVVRAVLGTLSIPARRLLAGVAPVARVAQAAAVGQADAPA